MSNATQREIQDSVEIDEEAEMRVVRNKADSNACTTDAQFSTYIDGLTDAQLCALVRQLIKKRYHVKAA